MSSSFDNVYRVTTLSDSAVTDAEIDELAAELSLPLPIGYSEYLTELGSGELCCWLRVGTPRQVRGFLIDADDWERETWLICGSHESYDLGCLTLDDLKSAVPFARSAEGCSYLAVHRFPGEFFHWPRGEDRIHRFPDGFLSLPQLTAQKMEHEFPFFEPRSLAHQWYEFGPDTKLEQVVQVAKNRWGTGGFCQSGDYFIFFRQAQCRLVIYAGEDHTSSLRLPTGSFSIVAHHDPATVQDVTAFFGMFNAVKN